MKTFHEFLNEGRDSPLYHATTVTSLYGVVSSGGFVPDTQHEAKSLGLHSTSWNQRVSGLSLTRDLRFAENWKPSEGVIFQLDQRQLSQRYKIVPFQYWQGVYQGARGWKTEFHKPNESEEFLISNSLVSLKYVRRVYLTKNALEYLHDMGSGPHSSEITDGVQACMNFLNKVGYEVY
jgi:hypothetical protein